MIVTTLAKTRENPIRLEIHDPDIVKRMALAMRASKINASVYCNPCGVVTIDSHEPKEILRLHGWVAGFLTGYSTGFEAGQVYESNNS